MKTKSRFGTKEKVLVIILAVLVTVIVFTSIFLVRGTRRYNWARQEAEELARQYGKITTVDQFYYFNREEQYFAVLGETAQGKSVYALIPEDGKEITILPAGEGISENQALTVVQEAHPELTALKVGLGKKNEDVVWEVSGKKGDTWTYILLSFNDGTVLSTIENI